MATNKKGKTSKNSRSSKKVIDYVKKERPKKQVLYIELTDEVLAEVMKESGMVDTYKNKKILKIERRFGKNYIKLNNTEEISAI